MLSIASIIIGLATFMPLILSHLPWRAVSGKTKYWFFLSTLAVIAILLCGVATSRYGAGVSSDSTKYLSVAQNLLAGNGLYDHKGFPLLSWPPLYSIILAGLSGLTGMDVFVAGWYFNVFLFGLNVFLSGVIFD